MSKTSSRHRRVAKPLQVSPLVARYVASLAPQAAIAAGPAVPVNGTPAPLVSKTWQGVTVNRYVDSYEIIFSDGRKYQAASPWKLLIQMLRGRK